jgi:hypothetical protein
MKELLDGAMVLKDWLGEGAEPVASFLSERRGTVCEICPKNQHPKWWEQATDAAAQTMKLYVEFKNDRKLTVPMESELHMCVVCKCCLPLKVHVPLRHILDHTSNEVMAALPDHCWIRNENP